jgi:chemotaxis protein methyltransferase CheR
VLDMRLEELTLTEEQFCRISDLVYDYCGINLHDGKKELVRSRLAKRLRTLKMRSFDDYLAYALKDPSGREFTHLIDALSTNLTSFFREPQHFAYLREHFYPALLARKREAKAGRLRAWSAGCSSGEEPYSIAISLLEAIEGQGRWDVKILATDLSTQVLSRAKEGVYEAARVAPLTGMQKQRYLIRREQGALFEVTPVVRSMVVFARLNLMQSWPVHGPVDFIFCRNVMIYFDKPTQQRLVQRFWDLLDSKGLLFTGHSESLTGVQHRFEYVQPTIYAKP